MDIDERESLGKYIRYCEERLDTKINLCDTCYFEFAVCKSDKIEYGDNIGNDNVIECEGFKNVR